MAHDVGDDESADGGGDQDRDGREDVDNEAGEGEAVWSGETAGEAKGAEDEDEEADHGEGVGGGDGEVLELRGGDGARYGGCMAMVTRPPMEPAVNANSDS